MIELTIDRSKWLRAGKRKAPFGPSWMSDSKGRRCCLGHLAVALGTPEVALVNRINPRSLGRS